MMLPHSSSFPYRRYIFVVVLVAAVAFALFDSGATRSEAFSDALSICIASTLGYAATRTLVWIADRLLSTKRSHLMRTWGLICFYGSLPLLIIGLYVGSWATHSPLPNSTTVAFVVAVAVSVSAAAFAAVRGTGRLTNAWSGRER